MRILDHLVLDVRAGVRMLRRSPSLAVVAVATLAMGIGATTALFTLVHGVLVRPLPYRDADRLAVVLAEQDFEGAHQPVRAEWPAAAVAAWPSLQTVESIGFYSSGVAALAGTPTSELVDVAFVAGSFFDTVDGRLRLGRGLSASDDLTPSVVISERLWRARFAGASGVLGRHVTLNGQPYAIVGVTAGSFQLPQPRTDVWLPAGFVRTGNPACCSFTPLVRLHGDASLARATGEIAAVARGIAAEMPRWLGGVRVSVAPLRDVIVGEVRGALLMLSAAVGLLLTLACVNVMNLLLARNVVRRHEVSVRRALGASRARLLLQGLVEAALLASAGGGLGVGMGALALRLLKAWPPSGLPRLDAVEMDGTVIGFVGAVAAAGTFAVGLLPALQGSAVAPALASNPRSATAGRRSRVILRTASVVQVAMSVVLLVGALLLGRSLAALMQTDLGVTPDGVATVSLNLAMGRSLTDGQQIDLVDRVVARVRSLPQVTAAGVGAARPPDASRIRLTLRRTDDANARATYQAAAVPATPGYFQALGIRLERGRLFTGADHTLAPPVVILSADTARRLFGDRDALGQTIGLPVLRDGQTTREEMTVVGITANVKYSGIDRLADDVVYRPFAQQAWRSVFLVARTSGDPEALVNAFQGTIAAVDPGITIAEAATLDRALSEATAQPRFRTWLLSAFAAMAVAMALVGIYGVITYSVSQRSREMSIRMALGADAARIRAMVLREGGCLALLGAALGLSLACGVAGLLAGLLYGIAPRDPMSFWVAAAGVISAAIVASGIPAVRAARADPAMTLRSE